jgi:PAS domain S-box-containing protein
MKGKYLFIISAVAAVYFVAAGLGLTLAYPGTNATPVWLPTGIALSAVLLLGYRIWPGVALGAFAANLHQLTGIGLPVASSLAASLGAAFGNTLEALAGAYLIRRFTGTSNPFDRSSDVVAFIGLGALSSSALSATIGTSTFCLSMSAWGDFAQMWLTWWLGDATGAIVLVPLAMTFNRLDTAGWKPRRLAADLLLWCLIGLVCYGIWSYGIALNFTLFPLLIIAAFRLGQFGSAVAVFIISIVSTYVTVNGAGPFSAATLTGSLLLQQGFIGSIAITSMVLAAIVSERKRSELMLSDSEKRYRTLIEQAPIGIALSRDGFILDANKACLFMFGYMGAGEMRGAIMSNRIEPLDGASRVPLQAGQDLGMTTSAAYETVGVRRDGSRFPLYVSENRIVMNDIPLTISFCIDITERKRAEEALRSNERKYRELVMNANSIILRWNGSGEITFMNEFGLKFFGYAEEEIVGRSLVGTIVPEAESTGRDLKILMDQICADPAGFEHNINENMRRNGERVWISWMNKVVPNEGGREREVLSVGSDITALKQTEAELQRHRERLEQLVLERTADLSKSQLALMNMVEDLNAKREELAAANDRLKELDRLKSMFIASMSHELRTPLNSIIGFTGMTLQGLSGELNSEQKDNLTRSYQSARHLLTLISDIIDISKIESGRIDSFPENVALDDLLAEAIGVVTPQLKEKGLALKVDGAAGLTLNTDKKRFLQCVLNFLSNAIKYTEEGTVTVSTREMDEDIELTVSDTGIGIAEKDMPRLFEAFERLDSHLRVKAGGTGLGLYLTRKIIRDILHGVVSAQSREGHGSSFTMRTPKDITKGY